VAVRRRRARAVREGDSGADAVKRRAALLRNEKYKGVPELAEALEILEAGKFKKAVAFVYSEAAEKVRTNKHVERANRRWRFCEKVRYKWRSRKG
jgi:hypothetical protein